jgi:hypothetical protein
MAWRKDHPGPKTKRAFRFWKNNGMKDLPNFVWKKRKLAEKNNGKTIINNFY